jgi:tetratricopeptide (TPR) repeat protein
LIGVVTLVAYSDTFSVPFLFDDGPSISSNPTIRDLWRLDRVWAPQSGSLAGRPIASLTFAVNRWIGGDHVAGYHAVNLLVHLLAALTLFGLIRRSVPGPRSSAIALVGALIWAVHPLQTEAVTYLSQRTESLMGMFYLLALYGFVRQTGVGDRGSFRSPGDERGSDGDTGLGHWAWLSVGACWLGMATKEVMVTAPIVILLYDRAFIASSFRTALNERGRYYLALGTSWVWLGYLMASSHLTSRGVGFSAGTNWTDYAGVELWAVARYLRLCFWPSPLIFDYGFEFPTPGPYAIAAFFVLLGGWLAGAWLLWRRCQPLGFLAFCGVVLLAPTSSVVPVTAQPVAESRMYLPLAVGAATVALGAAALGGSRGLAALGLATLALVGLTLQRNRLYRSELALWTDTVAKRPFSSRAHYNLGLILQRLGRPAEAIRQYDEALKVRPNSVDAHYNLALALDSIPGRQREAIMQYEAALRLQPDFAQAHNNLAVDLAAAGELNAAIAHLQLAIRCDPSDQEAKRNLAKLGAIQEGRPKEKGLLPGPTQMP